MTDNTNIGISLPFTFTLRHQAYTSARISSEGFITFPDANVSDSLPRSLLPNLSAQAIYGWWADLNPGSPGPAFRPSNRPRIALSLNLKMCRRLRLVPEYQLTFQIVLFTNGEIHLNYLDVPTKLKTMPVVTIGIEARDGLFYNQVACSAALAKWGLYPCPSKRFLSMHRRMSTNRLRRTSP